MAESKTRGRPTIHGLTPDRYYGGLCKKHPELKGLRAAANHWCVGCRRDATHRAANGLPSLWLRIRRTEYDKLLARIAELETRLYGAPQGQEP